MEIKNDTGDINYLEQKIVLCIDLLEIARAYCEFSYDRLYGVSELRSILEVILKNQREMAEKLDSMVTCG